METPLQALSSTRLTPEQRELERQTFGIAFEIALERLAEGLPMNAFCRSYHTPLSRARFLAWILRDEKRANAYHVALAIGAEAIEDDLIRIADGLDPDGNASPNDVQRSTLQINTRKWVLQVRNRRRYGDVKHIEQTTTTRMDVGTMSTSDIRERLLKSLGISENSQDIFEEARLIAEDEGE